jgi:hypothetical protein
MKVIIQFGFAAVALGLLAACANSAPSPPTPAPVFQTVVAPQTVIATSVPAASATNAPRPTETRPAESTPTNAPSPIPPALRRPRGIYAVVDLEFTHNLQKERPSITLAELHAYFNELYDSLVKNPAVSGLAIQVGWSSLNPNPPSSPQPYDWSYLDDAFSSVSTWNAANPTQAQKTIMISLFPGYFAPPWVLDQIPSCDGLFQSPPQTPPPNCGKATFVGYGEPHDELAVLPMPWNQVYKSAYRLFLTAFAARYDANPAFVSMDVGGPTAASTEILLPTNGLIPDQAQFGGISPNEMWLRLLAFAYADKPAYPRSDQAFSDAWNSATDMFGEIFRGVTLVIWTGTLPNFSSTGFTVPNVFNFHCVVPDMDCAAQMTIIAHFVDPTVGGANAKATAIANLNGVAQADPAQLSLHKYLAQSTAQFASPSAQILDGSQFGTGFSTGGIAFGCTSKFPPESKARADLFTLPVTDIPKACLAPGIGEAELARYKQFGGVPAKDLIPPEQALYNILRNYFSGTPAASSFGGTPGTAPENFLQIYRADFQYATTHVNAPAQVVRTDGTSVMMTAQDLLNLASQKLLEIGEPKRSP